MGLWSSSICQSQVSDWRDVAKILISSDLAVILKFKIDVVEVFTLYHSDHIAVKNWKVMYNIELGGLSSIMSTVIILQLLFIFCYPSLYKKAQLKSTEDVRAFIAACCVGLSIWKDRREHKRSTQWKSCNPFGWNRSDTSSKNTFEYYICSDYFQLLKADLSSFVATIVK